MICLPKELVSAFVDRLKSKEIDPQKLLEMTSEERRTSFESFLGKANAKNVNALFEKNMLLKNQQAGILNWIKETAGLKPDVARDMLARVNRMTDILQPKEMDGFLQDLASQKLGMGITLEEASHITDLAKTVGEKKEALSNGGDRLDYGRAKVAFDNYVGDLKNGVKVPFKVTGAISYVAGLAKSLKATLDDSVIGRQGLKVLFSEPKIWAKNSLKSFVDIARTFGGKEVMNEVKADVLSRPNAISGLYKKEGLAVGVKEEAYPTSFPEKIPLIGKIFKASEAAFQAFQYRTRADVFDRYVQIAEKSGADIQGIGKLANALTGRGSLGKLEPAANAVNNLFFSPRLLKSNIDALTAHLLDSNMSSFARKRAAFNTVKIISGVAGILSVANAVFPGSVQLDPRSSDFGKIRIGDTRFDVTGGMSALVTLASRLLTMSSKSSTTGKVTALNSGAFGAQTGMDVVISFLEGKLSPAASVVKDVISGKDFQGNPVTIPGEVSNLLLPLPIATFQELMGNPNSANVLAAMISDGLGFSTNTYSPNTNWSGSSSVELQDFKAKVGDKVFQQANSEFNQKYNEWYKSVSKVEKFKTLPQDEKDKVITKKKTELRTEVLKSHGFKYQAPKSKPIPKF